MPDGAEAGVTAVSLAVRDRRRMVLAATGPHAYAYAYGPVAGSADTAVRGGPNLPCDEWAGGGSAPRRRRHPHVQD